MKKIATLFLLLFFVTSVYAENFTEMSTQELIAIMGYVKPNNQTKFQRELQNRISTMSKKEKKMYQKNLSKLNK